ncbi:MAG: DUF4136 domain-containing protein [Myxococcota bacterium]|nr:DUF4136 domain-containing protein [Myxococcota bacterium]
MAGVAACSSVETGYEYDPETNFSAWRSYAWYPKPPPRAGDPRVDDPSLHERVAAAVDRRLVAMGFSREEEAPDFYVNFHLSIQRRLRVREIDHVYVGGPHGNRWGGAGWAGTGWTQTVVREYEEGALVIDLVDVRRRRVAWRGTGTRRLGRDPGADAVALRVDEAVDEILAQFPPR